MLQVTSRGATVALDMECFVCVGKKGISPIVETGA